MPWIRRLRPRCWPHREPSGRALKVLALMINLAIVAYLLLAKRLFGLRGGGRAARAEHERDTGWAAIERATPAPATPVRGPL